MTLVSIVCLGICCVDKTEEDPELETGTDTETDTSTNSDSEPDVTVAVDEDGDGFSVEDDCDDTDPNVNPVATEVCNEIDDDCDDLIDDDDDDVDSSGFLEWYLDEDEDGFGVLGSLVMACQAPIGHVDNADDCNDTDSAVNPDAQEICDVWDVDEDCDGFSDNSDGSVDPSGFGQWSVDADGDGFGAMSWEGMIETCDPPLGYAANFEDCDDTSAMVYPGATDYCGDQIDNDCDEIPPTNVVGFVNFNGVWSDVTADFLGTPEAPSVYETSGSGELHFCGGEYFVSITTTGDLGLYGVSESPNDVVLNGGGVTTVLTADASVDLVVSNLTLSQGYTQERGGVILCGTSGSTLILDTVIVSNGEANRGGGIYANGCAVTLIESTITGNIAFQDYVDSTGTTVSDPDGGFGGGLYVRNTDLHVFGGSVLSENVAEAGGGGVYQDTSGTQNYNLIVDGGFILDNSAGSAGGGVCVNDASITLNTIEIKGNVAYSGGGIYHLNEVGAAYTSQYSDMQLTGNSAARGGGAYLYDTPLTITGTSQIKSNYATQVDSDGDGIADDGGFGGGIYIRDHDLSLSGMVEVGGNSATVSGGGIYHDGQIEIGNLAEINSTMVTGNMADNGAGAFFGDVSVEIGSSVWKDNSALSLGGGIYVYADVDSQQTLGLTDVMLVENTADYGGGMLIFVEDDAQVTASCASMSKTGGGFLGNEALAMGGGLYVYGSLTGVVDFESVMCDFGDPADEASENIPHDIYINDYGAYDFVGPSNFICDPDCVSL